MTRLKQVQDFIDNDLKNNFFIEPHYRYEAVKERLFDVINTYNPGVIVKAGIGHGDILLEILKNFNSYIVVVEPSFSAINNFLQSYGEENDLQRIKFINGDFHDFPVDYYASNLIICIDYLDFFDSSKCIDEFKRALQFEGIFFFATVVLDDNDIEGIYDDFIRLLFPLHNDYYIQEDITTILELKDFKLIKNMQINFKNNLQSKIDYFRKIYNTTPEGNALEFIQSHKEDFVKFMHMNENYDITEPYYLGVYMRKKDKALV
ncbi:MAG: class I SAM-dependent methyltransferase [Spirochaetes bacterium]|nr:class I SAM-dependent methyltransferase [Spirochaetota bacterium]